MTDEIEVIVGRITKAHGVKGDVLVEVYTDEPELRFTKGSRLGLDRGQPDLTVKNWRWQANRLVVSFDSLSTREEAETLAGVTLTALVPVDAQPVDQAEFYDRHLIGLSVVLADGRQVGRVSDVLHGAAQDLLVVAVGEEEKLVPFVEELVPKVDLEANCLTVVDLPGLLE